MSATPNPAIPFAVLRNAHEGFRAGIKQLNETVATPAFAAAWQDYQRALSVHAIMEDTDVFDMLNQAGDNAIAKENIPEEHVKDHELVKAVEAALSSSDSAAVKTAFEEWKQHQLDHLAHEEKIMMPIVPKIGSNPVERARIFYEKVVTPADQRNPQDFEFFVGWCIKQLQTRGSTANTPEVAVRVFAHGLKAACSAEQWKRFLPIVQANASPEVYSMMVKDYQIDSAATQASL